MADSHTTAFPELEGAHERLEHAIEALRRCHVRLGWRLDGEAAARAAAHMRMILQEKKYMNDVSHKAVFGFCASREIDLDWVPQGKVDGMVCKLAGPIAAGSAPEMT